MKSVRKNQVRMRYCLKSHCRDYVIVLMKNFIDAESSSIYTFCISECMAHNNFKSTFINIVYQSINFKCREKANRQKCANVVFCKLYLTI